MTTSALAPKRRRVGLAVSGLIVWVAALIAGVVVLAVTATGPRRLDQFWDEETVQGHGAKIAMVEINGEILSGHGSPGLLSPGGFGADDYTSQLRQALEDDDVRAVIVKLDTPGGAVVASDDIYRMVRKVRSEKPVIALMGDVAASGGYYVAAGATTIIANPATITGSIGVIAMFPNFEGTAKKLGVRPVIIKSGRFKDIGSPYRALTPVERAMLQRLIDEAYNQFVSAVVQGRLMSRERVLALADGRIYSGQQALANHLVDEVGGIDDAIARARGSEHPGRRRTRSVRAASVRARQLAGGEARNR